MKTQLRFSSALLVATLAVIFGAARASADHFNAAYIEGADGVWEHDGYWTTSAYPNNGHFITNQNGDPVPGPNPDYDVLIDVATPCTLGIGVTIQTLNVSGQGTLNVQPGVVINANTGLGVTGLVNLNATNSSSHLRIGPALGGPGSGVALGGVISMSDSYANYISGTQDGGVTFTVFQGGTIRGAGALNLGYFGGDQHLLNYVNHGLIDATQPNNALNIGLGGQEGVNANLTNDSLVRASGSGTLRIHAFNTFGNVFNNNGTLAAIDNGTLRVVGGVTVIGGTLTTLANGTIRGDSPGGNGGGLLRDLTNAGAIALANGETLSLAGAFVNNGTISMDSGSELYLRGDTTISGTGTIRAIGTDYNYAFGGDVVGRALTIGPGMSYVGPGQLGGFGFQFGPQSININNQGLLHNNVPQNSLRSLTQSFVNSGTVRATGATYTFRGGGTVANNGVFEAINGGTIDYNDGPQFTNYSNGTLTGGIWRAATNGPLTQLSLNMGPITTNAATVILSGANAQFPPINSLTQNNGTLVLNDGATLTLSSSASSSARRKARQTNGTFPNAGALVLGNGSSLNVNGDFSQGSGGSLEVVIGAAYPQDFHALNVSGTASLAGTLIVKLANGYAPAPNETLPIIQAGAIAGGFVNVIGATVSYGPNGVSVHPTGNTSTLLLTRAVSRKTHGGAGTFDIDLPGVECRASAGGNHKLVFTFSNTLANAGATYTNGTETLGAMTTIAGNTLTVDLSGVSDQENVTLNLNDVTDVYSQVLDTAISVRFLIGDANADGSVNSADATITRNRSGHATDATNFRADYNTDGDINSADATIVRAASGHSVP